MDHAAARSGYLKETGVSYLGSRLIIRLGQKITVAARATAAMKIMAHLS